MAIFSPIIVARFWSKVAVTPSNLDCWEWSASRNRDGYGKFKFNGTVFNASRIAWEISNGERLGRDVARHTCDNPGCCNPSHLIRGSQADNLDDMHTRGRARNGSLAGEMNPRAKLSARDVAVIRRRIAGGQSNTEIAADYPVSAALISKIRTGNVWT